MTGVDHRAVSGFDPAAHADGFSGPCSQVQFGLKEHPSRPPVQRDGEFIAPVFAKIQVNNFAHPHGFRRADSVKFMTPYTTPVAPGIAFARHAFAQLRTLDPHIRVILQMGQDAQPWRSMQAPP
jgi:hypothetical protein